MFFDPPTRVFLGVYPFDIGPPPLYSQEFLVPPNFLVCGKPRLTPVFCATPSSRPLAAPPGFPPVVAPPVWSKMGHPQRVRVPPRFYPASLHLAVNRTWGNTSRVAPLYFPPLYSPVVYPMVTRILVSLCLFCYLPKLKFLVLSATNIAKSGHDSSHSLHPIQLSG